MFESSTGRLAGTRGISAPAFATVARSSTRPRRRGSKLAEVWGQNPSNRVDLFWGAGKNRVRLPGFKKQARNSSPDWSDTFLFEAPPTNNAKGKLVGRSGQLVQYETESEHVFFFPPQFAGQSRLGVPGKKGGHALHVQEQKPGEPISANVE